MKIMLLEHALVECSFALAETSTAVAYPAKTLQFSDPWVRTALPPVVIFLRTVLFALRTAPTQKQNTNTKLSGGAW